MSSSIENDIFISISMFDSTSNVVIYLVLKYSNIDVKFRDTTSPPCYNIKEEIVKNTF